ncbi:tetratricopeptide repeat protein [Arenicella xantha]|uniref:Tetratricopeptide repeat protein n=1 Tax=Arenicella xantha TaxID=644221 RepID=A0A395JP10_9GAMM|nr:hypothetical protein [Arenicella xantha]RBP53237.1 hypothetical protein DFR28_101623 [Arenicella xantha]
MNDLDTDSVKLGTAIKPAAYSAPGELLSKPREGLEGKGSGIELRVTSRWWHSEFNLMLAAFGLLAVAAVLFVMLTPTPESTQAKVSKLVQLDGTSQVEQAVIDVVAPWDESQGAEARADAQDILADVLTLKKNLESKDVREWADDRFSSALGSATSGDEFYKRQQFAEAIQAYQTSRSSLEALLGLVPEVLDAKLAAGEDAISLGKTDLARGLFEQALRLERNNIEALKGLDRAKTLDQVLLIVSQAKDVEERFKHNDELTTALQAQSRYEEALALDAAYEPALVGLDRVKQDIVDKRYRDAMTAGFNSLFAAQYTAAKNAFSSALTIRPNDPTAAAAYRQSLASDKRSSLSALLSSAKQLEANEQWRSALSNYQVVLQRDPNQITAKLGKIRASARAQLQAEIESVLSDQLALAREAQRRHAETVLADAKAIRSPGPSLLAQITQIESAFQRIDTNLKVALTSDSATSVTLVRDGSKPLVLGRFTQKNLALKPGRYLVSGERLGFHDVRRELELHAGGDDIIKISIVCTQPIVGNVTSAESKQAQR